MTRKICILFVSSFFVFSTAAFAASPLEEYKPFSARIGVGASLGPETFFGMANAEYHVDRFVSFGPMVQMGFSNTTDFVLTTAGGRLTLPLHALKIAQVSLYTGAGFAYRDTRGFTFNNFVYTVGSDVDVLVWAGLTAGVGAALNVTSSDVERLITTLYATASYQF